MHHAFFLLASFLGYQGYSTLAYASLNEKYAWRRNSVKRELKDDGLIGLGCEAVYQGWPGDFGNGSYSAHFACVVAIVNGYANILTV